MRVVGRRVFREDEPIGRIARYIAHSRLGAELAVRLDPIKQKAEPHYQRVSAFYKQHCAPTVLRTHNFIKTKTADYKKYREQQRRIAEDQAVQQAEAARKREAELDAERVAAERGAYDPEAAIEDMRLAHSYLEDWIADKGDHVLGLAAKYIELARTKDRNAKLIVEIKKGENKGETDTLTQDDLSGTALFYESQLYSYADASKEHLERARELLKRAIAYRPYTVQYRRHLAQVYLNLHDKQSALAIAEEAVKKNPRDLDARKLLDFAQAAPVTHAPTFFEANPGCLLPLISLAFLIFTVILVVTGQYSTAFGVFVVGLVVLGIGSFFEKDHMLQKAIEKQDRDRANKR